MDKRGARQAVGLAGWLLTATYWLVAVLSRVLAALGAHNNRA